VPSISKLDLVIGARRLIKYPGLTLIGGFAIAMATAVGAASFESITEVLRSDIPLHQGERLVSLQYATGNQGNPERRIVHDFVAWRGELRSVRQLSAFRQTGRNLVPADGRGMPIQVAEITASGFEVARTAPRLGRYLVEGDEREGAPPVVVIGHDAWQSRFEGDPAIVGRTINLSGVQHTVVGVMPDGFEFPVYHQYWVPLRADPLAHERLRGPSLYVFGRLAPGATLEQAQTELTVLGRRTAAAHPELYRGLRAVVQPYPWEHLFVDDPTIQRSLWSAQLVVSLLMVVVFVNLAILMYARTVVRRGEIALRIALGASRRGILALLFIEAFVLSVLGAAGGLLLAQFLLGSVQAWTDSADRLPFWVDLNLSGPTALFAFGSAVIAAVIVGVLPGLKVTDRRIYGSLAAATATGKGLGGMWTFLIVAQVAVAVTILPMAISTVWQLVRMQLSGPGFPAEQMVIAQLGQDEKAAAAATAEERSAADALARERQAELIRRLEAEPGVSAVTFSDRVPQLEEERAIELEGAAATSDDVAAPVVHALQVGPELFDVYDAEILAGRGFDAGDMDGAASTVIVNRTFVERYLGNASALGRRFHYSQATPDRPDAERVGPSYQIVGVVSDFPAFLPPPGMSPRPKAYHLASAETLYPVVVSVRLRGGVPDDFVGRVRKLGAEVDPAMRVSVTPLAEFYRQQRSFWRFGAWGLGMVLASVLLLSAAGIYAMTSFTVAQRTREIGIRSALGAQGRHILLGIFSRVIRQLAIGVGVGALLAGALFVLRGADAGRAAGLLLIVATLISVVGLLAAVGPARRGLRIQPTEALRES